MKDKISVIICVYNTEKYLNKCLDSIINQSYSNLEIIIVNDASGDNSLDIINNYKNKDDRILLINNKKNIGLAASRNEALEIASGKFISFIDSDDYVGKDYYEELYKSIKNYDISVCDIRIVSENLNSIIKCGNHKNTKEGFINNGLAASACNKLFKKELFDNVRYPDGLINEDVAVILPILVNTKKINYTDKVYYNYIQRNGSIQNSKVSFKKFDIFKTVDLAIKKIDDNNIADMIIFNQIILLLFYTLINESRFINRYKLLKKYFNMVSGYNIIDNRYYLNFLTSVGKKHRLYYKFIMFLCKYKLPFIASSFIQVGSLIRKIISKNVIKDKITDNDIIKTIKKNQKIKSKHKVSVVIPNYNYSTFLYQRIYSIINQNYKIYEIIILDDNSSDDSIKVIDKIVKLLDPYINVKVIFNKKNSGSAFKQWKLGFENAIGEYVWIAEADDYCDRKLISNLMNGIDENVIISYSDTSFIDKCGNIIMKSVVNDIDIQNTGHYSKSFVNDGYDELKNYTYLNCTIANVSSCIIKNGKYNFFDDDFSYKQAGDWYIYANLMLNGKVKYVHKQLNYYRLHGSNITSVTKKKEHLDEIKSIHEYLDSVIKFNKDQKEKIKQRYKYLKKVWDLE